MRTFTFIYFAVIVSLQTVWANNIEIRTHRFTTRDGLSNNTVRHIYQDQKGFLWFSTLNGLDRYDGISFVNYHPSLKKSVSLVDNRIYNVVEDKNGCLWINTTSEQFSCFDLQAGRFVDYTGKGEYRNNYSKILLASNGNVWLWHPDNGFRCVKKQKGVYSSVAYKAEFRNVSSSKSNFVVESGKGDIWLGTKKGLTLVRNGKSFIVDKKSGFQAGVSFGGIAYFVTTDGSLLEWDTAHSCLQKVSSLPESIPEGGELSVTTNFVAGSKWYIFTQRGGYIYDFKARRNYVNAELNEKNITMTTDNKGDFWLYNKTGKLRWIKHHGGSMKEFQLIPPDKVGFIDNERYHVVQDSRGIVWISTYGNGLFAYMSQTGKLENFLSNQYDSNLFGSNFLNYVAEDRSGEIWVSCEYTGLSRITVVNGGSDRLFVENNTQNDRSNAIRVIHRMKNGEIWISTRRGGLYEYDSQLKNCKKRRNFSYNVYSIEQDAQNNVWLGTRGDGLCVGDEWYKNNPNDKTSLANNNIFCIYRDRRNRMWIGTFGEGLDLAVRKGNKYQFRHFFEGNVSQRQIRVIKEDRNGYLWIGTSDGLYIFNPDVFLGNPKAYYHFSINSGHLMSDDIKCLRCDKAGRMWFGMSGSGFGVCQPVKNNDYANLKFEFFSVTDGLVDNMVQSMEEDERGNMWISTEYGLSKMDYKRKSFVNFFLTSYQLGNVYSENTSCTGNNGELWFGTNYGLVKFDPGKLRPEPLDSKVNITHIKINGIDVFPDDPDSPLKGSISYAREIDLKYNQNSFVIDFSTFNYSDNNIILYSYKLVKYDKDWSVPSPLNFAAYKNLSPGTYRLEVKACNSNGVWNSTPTILVIHVHPPFWRTWWAFLFYFILLVILMFFVYRVAWNFTRLRNRISVEKQLTDYKLLFFTNISHEFRTPLTLIEGSLERIQGIKELPSSMQFPLKNMDKSVKRMMRLIDQLLEFRKMQHNKLSLALEEIDVIAFLKEIGTTFKDTADSKKMFFTFKSSVSSYMMFVDKGHVDKIIYNLLSNSFKYTPTGGKICFEVKVDEDAKNIKMIVKDNGVGVPKEKQSELFSRFMQSNFSGSSMGVGLHLSRELAEVHHGSIIFHENEGGGCVFILTLPTDKSIYKESDFLIPDNAILKEENNSFLLKESEPSVVYSQINPLNKKNILVIEDDTDVRMMLKDSLGTYFNVETEPDGTTGLKHAQDNEVDLIVCDVLMPGLSGYEVTSSLKSDLATSHIPVILLTALSTTENHIEGISRGADAYIVKPFSMKLLLARIFNLLEQRNKLRMKFSSEPGILLPAICTTDRDKDFVDRLHIILEKNLGNSDFSIDDFAVQMKMGRTIFYKKVRGITGYSPNEFIRVLRMKKAAELLLERNLTVSEVAYRVGIDDPFYFSKCFKTQFGVSPSAYMKGKADDKPQNT